MIDTSSLADVEAASALTIARTYFDGHFVQ